MRHPTPPSTAPAPDEDAILTIEECAAWLRIGRGTLIRKYQSHRGRRVAVALFHFMGVQAAPFGGRRAIVDRDIGSTSPRAWRVLGALGDFGELGNTTQLILPSTALYTRHPLSPDQSLTLPSRHAGIKAVPHEKAIADPIQDADGKRRGS